MHILIVEDEILIARDLATTVETFGHVVVGMADSGPEALALAAAHHPDLALMDIHLAGPLDGIATAQQLEAERHIPVIYLTAHADGATMERAAATYPVGYLLKPFDERALWSVLELARYRQQLDQRLQRSEARFAATLRSLGDAVLVTDVVGQITFANGVAAALIGLAHEALVGQPLDTTLVLVDAMARQPLPSLVLLVGAVDEPVQMTVPTLLLAHDGRVWPLEGSAAPIRDDAGTFIGVVVVVREISARQQAEAALRDSNAQMATALRVQERRTVELHVLGELGRALTRCTSLEDGYASVTHAAQRLFPEVAGALFVSRHTSPDLEPVIAWGAGTHPFPPLNPACCRVLREHRVVFGGEPCGGCRCEALPPALSPDALCVPLRAGGETIGVLHVHLAAIAPDAPEEAAQRQLAMAFGEQAALGLANVRLRAILHEQAIRDPLTGLFNRRFLEETLLRELHRAMCDRYPVGVIMLDVDHFKRVNDAYGHDAGDTVLRTLGALLLSIVRDGDVVCRYGGEEFVLMLPKAPLAVVLGRAEAIRHAVSVLSIAHHDLVLPGITVSLGVSVLADEQTSGADALACADAALYAAKRAGRNRVVAHESILAATL